MTKNERASETATPTHVPDGDPVTGLGAWLRAEGRYPNRAQSEVAAHRQLSAEKADRFHGND